MPTASHQRRAGELLLAVALFSALAIWSTYPLIVQLEEVVPGLDPGDNLGALWNTWWFQDAIRTGVPVYRTSSLFVPLGTQLSLHTHATAHSLLAWPWTLLTTVVAAHNLAILTGLAVNGICAFVLARQVARRFLPALAAGWVFAASAFVQVHLLGHVNFVHAWVLPLFAIALARFTQRQTAAAATFVGIAAALAVYTDYYYAVYCVLMAVTWGVARAVVVSAEPPRRRFRRAGRLLFALAGLAALGAAAIAMSGGTVLELGGLRVSLRSARNPLTLAWLLTLAAAVCVYPARPRIGWRVRPDWTTVARVGLALLVCAALTLPVGLALLEVVRAGDYTSPRILWRSSPAGADILTLVLGHPRHAVTGSYTARAYETLGVDLIEQSLWLGIAPIILILTWRRHWSSDRIAKTWLLLGTLFLAMSLGPFLRISGYDTGIPLPFAAARYLPIVANARMPGRAVIVVHLAVALILAAGWSRRRPAAAASLGILVLVMLESLPGPVPLYRLPQPDRVDAALAAAAGAGAVVELPTGRRDGFGQAGDFDHRALVHQMAHRRPLAGGFVARLSPSITRHYDQDPVLSRLVELSSPASTSVDLPAGLAEAAAARGLRFVVVNRDRLDEQRLPRAGLEQAGFRFVVSDGRRELFRSF